MNWFIWLSSALFYGNFLEASITGITYMDNFDFAQRYRDVNECNPFHWHPLHLPEECLQMFEKLIRSRLQSLTPYRIVTEKQQETQSVSSYYSSSSFNIPVYEAELLQPIKQVKTLSPLEILFKLLRNDIRSVPSAPSMAISPFLGMVALYRQPVSYKTVDMINKLSKAYANSYY